MKNKRSAESVGLWRQLDAWIVAGQVEQARENLLAISWRNIARDEIVNFARLARRIHLPDLSLSLLHPLVRTATKSTRKATAAEEAEYAAALIQIGAVGEAEQILGSLTREGPPVAEIPLFQAYARMTCWDYAATIPLLHRYLATDSISEYERAIGEINLAAALVHEREDHAETALLDFLSHTSDRPYHRLRGHAWLLLAEWLITRSRWEPAERALTEVESVFTGVAGVERLFVAKWKAVGTLARKRSESALPELRAVKTAARKVRHWETVRDCDFHEAVSLGNEKKFLQLYFGTPYEHYRKYLHARFAAEVALPEKYDWKMGTKSESNGSLVDIYGDDSALKPGTLLHRLFGILCSDFYKPLRIADIHDRLYAGEFFNPETSPKRVHQALQRLRKWLSASESPLSIEEFKGTYRFAAEGPCRIVVPLARTEIGYRRALLQKLRSRLPHDRAFTAKQAAHVLEVPAIAAKRMIKQGCDEGVLRREGKRRLARYWFT